MYRSRTTPALVSQHTWGIGIGQGPAAVGRSLRDEAGSGIPYVGWPAPVLALVDVAAMHVATTGTLVYQGTREREEIAVPKA
jgi:hypothetical protein